ncbi:MAG: CrcB family protein [Planctomycetota bacterium]|nr:CrcB family protein [Planctomycetota bacterium]
MLNLLLVAIGGAVGAAARHGINAALPASGKDISFATLSVNVIGSFAAGWLAARSVRLGAGYNDAFRCFSLVGFFGAFTTFSAFSVEAAGLWREGKIAWMAACMASNCLLSLAAALAGGQLAWPTGS